MNKGVLLVNLGSPDSTSVRDVRRYLAEFLMDKRVIDVNPLLRACIVYLGILPFRPRRSAEAYRKVWTAEGSPLVAISRRVVARLQPRLAVPLALAMRYQNPSISQAVAELKRAGVREVLLIPLFPQYATSSYETAVVRVRERVAALAPGMQLRVQPPFFENPDYIGALVANAQDSLKPGFDHLLFSFHGLPERHIRKADPTGCHCLTKSNCCEGASPARATCYRAQCFATVAAFVKQAGIPGEKYSISFQSRLGRDPWLKPYTDFELPALAQRGVKRLCVMCPAFVSDCLETLEEIGIRGRESFVQAGGKELCLVPCLNEHPLWLRTLEKMIGEFLSAGEKSSPQASSARQ